MKKILFIHNHKDFSGAAKSLSETIKTLKLNNEINVVCPMGSSSSFFKDCNINVINVIGVPRFNHFESGYYKGFRWLVLIREIIFYIYFIYKLILIKKKLKSVDIVHLNEFELIVIAPIIHFFLTKKISSHLRSRLETIKGKLRIRFIKYISKKFINKIIAIDQDCYETSYCKEQTEIVYNVLENQDQKKVTENFKKNLTFGFIGNFLSRKGIYDLLLAFKRIYEKKIPIDLLVGGNQVKRSMIYNFLNSNRNFNNFVFKNSIDQCENIKFIGKVTDLNKFYSKIDVLIFPSYLNSVGRPVIESSLFKIPSIIGLKKFNNDTAIKNASLIFTPGDIEELYEKILFFHINREKIVEMGLNAYNNAVNLFDHNKNTKKFINILNKL